MINFSNITLLKTLCLNILSKTKYVNVVLLCFSTKEFSTFITKQLTSTLLPLSVIVLLSQIFIMIAG